MGPAASASTLAAVSIMSKAAGQRGAVHAARAPLRRAAVKTARPMAMGGSNSSSMGGATGLHDADDHVEGHGRGQGGDLLGPHRAVGEPGGRAPDRSRARDVEPLGQTSRCDRCRVGEQCRATPVVVTVSAIRRRTASASPRVRRRSRAWPPAASGGVRADQPPVPPNRSRKAACASSTGEHRPALPPGTRSTTSSIPRPTKWASFCVGRARFRRGRPGSPRDRDRASSTARRSRGRASARPEPPTGIHPSAYSAMAAKTAGVAAAPDEGR